MKGLGATLTTLVFTPSKTRSYQDRRPSSVGWWAQPGQGTGGTTWGSGGCAGQGRGWTLVRRLLHQSREGDGVFGYGGSREQARCSQIPSLF